MTARVFPGIVEIIGLAGAGKTSLCHALSQSKSIHLGNFPDVRRISNAPFFIWNGLQISPLLLDLQRHSSRKLTRREFAWLSILNGWPEELQKELEYNKIIVLDQGPVYLLAEIREFGPAFLKIEEAEKMWRDLYSRWADRLDMIVWLDAQDIDLMKRIRNRDKGHLVKNQSVEVTLEFLACYRRAYERTISNLLANNPDLKILRFDTSQKSAEETACQLLIEFGSARETQHETIE
jgi:shikimate kinase